ncbi:hypothetical protein DVV91_02655 [Clostridium botulinum]|uniref:hypothetical protein n=1 Tax=Clostridium botulinum TaxID=1491 RepID=UPI001967499A|nr:hypothetical protein [Clostridium botulinum]MBN1073244.1 hypothetical protein [Clostridium botulinum]
MKTFIKNYDLANIKLKYKLMYMSYISVIIFHFIVGKIKLYSIECSQLLNLNTNSIFSLATIILIPGALLYFLYNKLNNKTDKELKTCNIFVNLNLLMILISFTLLLFLLFII